MSNWHAKSYLSPWLWLLLALLLLPIMPTHDSLWLDEGNTAMYAMQPDLHSWFHHLLQDRGADCQMPLSLFFAWIGGRVLGVGEWQMRAVNLLWGVLALVGMYRMGRRLRIAWLPLLLAIQPFFWFYMNEARPYALEIACGTWLLVAFVEFLSLQGNGESWAWLLVVSVFFLFLTTLLAPIPVMAVVISGAMIAARNHWRPGGKAWLVLLAGAVANIPAAIYYLSTCLRGVHSAMLWRVNLKSFGYVVYELTGMTGLGLPSAELRALAKSGHVLHMLMGHWPYFILPAIGFSLLLAVLALGWRHRADAAPPRVQFGLASVLALTAVAFIVASLVLHKALWARHLAPAFPFYVSLLGLAMADLLPEQNRMIRWTPYLLAGLLIFSSLNLRFSPSWRKENYRAAAAYARQALAENKSVWWVASDYCAEYYGLPCALERPEVGKVFCPQSDFASASSLPPPEVIIYSRPEVFDSHAVVQKIIRQDGYREAAHFISFVIWTNAAPPTVAR